MPGSGKLHYCAEQGGTTLCGRSLTGMLMLRVTADPSRVTCAACKHSPHLDGYFGNMTHAGH